MRPLLASRRLLRDSPSLLCLAKAGKQGGEQGDTAVGGSLDELLALPGRAPELERLVTLSALESALSPTSSVLALDEAFDAPVYRTINSESIEVVQAIAHVGAALPGQVFQTCTCGGLQKHTHPERLVGLISFKKSRHCQYPDCEKRASSGALDKQPSHCAPHGRLYGFAYVTNARCDAEEGCATQSCFGMPDDARPSRCKKHASSEMVDIRNRHCATDGCTTILVFGLLGDARPSRCKKHASPEMVDIRNRRCAKDGCTTQPVFGLLGDARPRYCKEHALPGMVNIRIRHCAKDGCTTQPSYGDLCSMHFAEANPESPFVLEHNKTEAKLRRFLDVSLGASFSADSTYNAQNVRGLRAKAFSWLKARGWEADFILAKCVELCCDGGQHFEDVSFFKSLFAEQLPRDIEKAEGAITHKVGVCRLEQDAVWRDLFVWQPLLKAMLCHCVSRARAGKAIHVVGLRSPADLIYDGYVAASLESDVLRAVTYKMFLTPKEPGTVTLLHCVSGTAEHFLVPTAFQLVPGDETVLEKAMLA